MGSPLEEGQIERLAAYVDILRSWNDRVRLLGDRDPNALVRKHIPDCLALVPFLRPIGPLADIGTGPGLPGLVLSCVRPDLDCWLIESRRRRVSFLFEVRARLGLERVVILEERAEQVARREAFEHAAETVTARAVALEAMIACGLPLLKPTGTLLCMQSQRTPIASVGAEARARGLEITDSKDYHLAGGELRRILVLTRLVSRET